MTLDRTVLRGVATPVMIAALVCGMAGAAGAQRAWQPPASVTWPLLDIGVTGDSANGLIVMMIPSPAALEGANDTHSRVEISVRELRRWLPTARTVLDSVQRLPLKTTVAPWGVTLRDPRGQFAIILGANPAHKPDRLAVLQLRDTAGSAGGWSGPGPLESARALLQVLDGVAAVPGTPRPRVRLATDLADCQGSPAVVTVMPKLRVPPKSGWGGRVVLSYVVDTTGTPVDSTVRVLLTSGDKFTAEVQRVFPDLRYRPARCRTGPVPVLVEQGFLMHN